VVKSTTLFYLEDAMESERKIVVMQKIVDDYYVNTYVWEVVDENGNCYGKGEGKSIDQCLETGRKYLKRKKIYKENHSENESDDDSFGS
jgi:hypothetical protein